MITVTLKLRRGQSPTAEPCAWFVPGGDAAVWLDEIATWGVPHEGVCVLPVPRSQQDPAPCGVLVLPGSTAPPAPSPRCVPFSKQAGCLYIPADARFDPYVSDAELREMLSADVGSPTYVWHPAVGLVKFEPAEVLRLSDLIEFEPPLARLWDAALPGVTFSRRLISLMPEQSLTFEQLLEEGRDDIGTESPDAEKLPPGPREAQPGLGNSIARHGTKMLANMAQWLANHAPGTASSPTWVNSLENWARQKLANIYAGLDAERNKEITRLLNLLASDPDKGLRYALPMGGDAHRGIAPPTSRLGERRVDFNLGGLGGGGAADFWDLSAKHQQDLLTRYRELANREINLGRHRRAAYIFAHLLGDFSSAASALEAGQHWREAAVLYQQKLKRLMEAARCLEQGGLWAEALALYQELMEHEKAGDLFVKIGQLESADVEYRTAAGILHDRGAHVAASQLYLDKIDSPDEAINELTCGWPASSQAVSCLSRLFHVLGNLGRHETAQQWITQLREQGAPDGLRIPTVEILADTATQYPDRITMLAAGDCTRRLISGQLPAATQGEAQQLLSSLRKLAPEDRLLTRDCQRFVAGMTAKVAPRQTKTDTVKRPRIVRTITLPSGIYWKAATYSGDTIYAAGFRGQEVCVVRAGWDGTVDVNVLSWSVTARSGDKIILSTTWLSDNSLLVHLVGSEPLRGQRFVPTHQFPDEQAAGSAQMATTSTCGACRASYGVTWRWDADPDFALVAVERNGQVASTTHVPIPAVVSGEDLHIPFPMHARSNRIYMGLGSYLHVFDSTTSNETIAFPQTITSLSGSAPNTRTRIAITFPQGAAIFWDDVEGQRTQKIADDRSEPVAGFNRGGYLIVADHAGCEIYGTSGRHAKLEGTLGGISARPIAVLSAPRTDQFGIVFDNGQIYVYELP